MDLLIAQQLNPDSLPYIYILTPAGITQRYYIAGAYEKRKDRKTQKSRSEERVVPYPPIIPPPFQVSNSKDEGENENDRCSAWGR